MSFPNSPNFAGSPEIGHQRNSKSRLRSVRLELPSRDFSRRMSPSPILATSPTTNSFGSVPSSIAPQPARQRNFPITFGAATCTSPNVMYSFPENTTQSFVLDVVTPDNAFPFVTHPDLNLVNPHFLLYIICSTSISTTPVKIILNGTSMSHWITDPKPLDVTNFLVPFGQQNWLIVETGNFVVPFAIVGVWSSFFTMKQVIEEIEKKEKFPFTEVAAVCPITGQQIETPAKGCNCMHDNCFDLASYITSRQALGVWLCPICNMPLPLNDLRVGEVQQYKFNGSMDGLDQIWGSKLPDINDDQEDSMFWMHD